MRSIEELEGVADPAWPMVDSWITHAGIRAERAAHDPDRGRATLLILQVTERSVLGAMARHSGGVFVDHRWLRILGGGIDPMLNLAAVNDLTTIPDVPPGRIVVATDVIGGTFAINGGDFAGQTGEVHYFAPDELTWLPMGMGHGEFVDWALSASLATFSEHLRWPGWEAEIEPLGPADAVSLYPFPFTREGRDVGDVSHRVVPWRQLAALYRDIAVIADIGGNPTQ